MIYENTYKAKQGPFPGTLLASITVKPRAGTKLEAALHTLRSCLNVVSGNTELMLDGALGKITPGQNGGLQDILESSRRMLAIINDISDRRPPSEG